MSCIINFEREFFRIAKDLERKEEVRQEFLAKISALSEEWIDGKLRLGLAGLKD